MSSLTVAALLAQKKSHEAHYKGEKVMIKILIIEYWVGLTRLEVNLVPALLLRMNLFHLIISCMICDFIKVDMRSN